MKNKNVLISGASVAGPALAFWLRRYGFNPTVVEQAPAPRPGGQAVDLRGAGRVVAERMGIMEEVKKVHTGAKGMAYVNKRGERVATMGADLMGDSGGPIAEVEILRGDLVNILYNAGREDVEYLFNDTITGMVETSEGIQVTFARSQPRTFDLVVGADGVHSKVRSLAFGPEEKFSRDLGAYVATFTAGTQVDLEGWELMHTVAGKRGGKGCTAALYPMESPERAIGIFFFDAPDWKYDRQDLVGQKRALAAAFANVGWEVPRMIETMWKATDFYFDRCCQIKMERWSNGRTVLLGDAAHSGSPMGGNGTSMALVGAYVLAGELAEAQGNYVQAFARYEEQMREFVRLCQKFAEAAPMGLLPSSLVAIWVYRVILKSAKYFPLKWKDAIFGAMTRAANAISLKDYQLPRQAMAA